jgi:hypothetical protein
MNPTQLEMVRLASNGNVVVIDWNSYRWSQPVSSKQRNCKLESFTLSAMPTRLKFGRWAFRLLRAADSQ